MGALNPRHVRRLLLALVLGVVLTACGGSQRPREPARLQVSVDPPNATVYLDDRFLGTARRLARRPEAIRPGIHHLTVKAPGHFPHDVELDLPAGLTSIELSLRPIPP